MATVPTYDGPQVRVEPLPLVPQTATRPGDTLQQLGQGLSAIGDVAERIAARDDSDAAFRAETAAKSAYLDFADQAKKRMVGEQAKGFRNEVDKFWAGAAEKYGQELNPRAQQLVGRSLAQARMSSIADADSYEKAQLDHAQTQAWAASKAVAIDQAAKSSDPTIGAELASATIRQRNAQQAAIKGWDAAGEQLRAQNLKDLGALHSTMLTNLIEQNQLPQAKAYLGRYAEDMDPSHLIRAQQLIKRQDDSIKAMEIGGAVVTELVAKSNPVTAVRLAAVALPSLTDAVRNAESGGRTFGANGELLKGPITRNGERAEGDMQVMPATQRDPGYGIKPVDRTLNGEALAADVRRVGQQKLDALLKRFSGDIPKTVASYNWGERNVDKAIAEAGPTGDWLASAPKETQDYVVKVLKAYTSGEGVPAKPTLQQVQEAVKARVGYGNPELLKLSLSESERNFELHRKGIKQRDEEATRNAQEWLAKNNGQYARMPASIREAVPPDQIDNLLSYAQKIYKGLDITNPVAFNKMATDDAYLKNMSDNEFYIVASSNLSQADHQQMALRRGNLLNPDRGSAKAKPEDLDYSAINAPLNNRLAQLGIDPTPPDKNKEDLQRVGLMRKIVWDTVLQAQVTRGKKLSDGEIATVVDDLFARNVQFQQNMFGFTKRTSETLMTMKPGDVPPDIANKIKDDFKARGVTSPSDYDVLGAYQRLKLAQGR